MSFFVGLDWGANGHAVCVIDERSDVVARVEVKHDAAGLADPLARLKRIAPPETLPVAIERPSGLVVETLIAAGFPVVPIHPNVVKACRPRYRAAAAKSDPGDAYMHADILRTDGHRFRPLTPVSDELRALRALVRGRDDLVAARARLANQLRSLLEGFRPGAAAIFADVDSRVALAFLTRFPSPESARRLGPSRMRAFMAQNRHCGRRSAEELLARLRAAPKGLADEAEADAKGELVRALVRTLGPLAETIRDLSGRIEHAVENLPDGRIVMSFPRAGRIRAAQILAELGDVRERFGTDAQLAAEAGVCPSPLSLGPMALQRRPHASGKSRGVVFRWACNHRLRAAVTCFADNSRHASPWAADVYRRARGRGCDHPHAIRVLARAWLRILWRAWTDRRPYDPERHAAAQTLIRAA